MQSHLKNTVRKMPYSKPANIQTLYCQLCKVSCAGEQSYKEHCEGQKHKKKEINPNKKADGKNFYFCDLCQVPCSCLDSYNAHLSGKNHLKVCNLQTKLGKEIPPELIAPIMRQENSQNLSENETLKTNNTVRVIGTPAINFVKGESLRTMAGEVVEIKNMEKTESNEQNIDNEQDNVDTADDTTQNSTQNQTAVESTQSQTDEQIPLLHEPIPDNIMLSNNDPIGLEFIFEYRMQGSKATYYSCDLCDCKFSEKNAKEQHVRGKRHHKAYNKHIKNNSQNIPSIKITMCNQNSQEDRTPPPLENLSTLPLNKPPKIASLLNNHQASTSRPISSTPSVRRSILDETIYIGSDCNELSYINHEASFMNDFDIKFEVSEHMSNDDKYMYKKHSEIIPKEEEIKMFYKKTLIVEKVLKEISDEFFQNLQKFNELFKLSTDNRERILAGELRAGLFGKKLLLNGEKTIDLILICSVKPNVQLLKKLTELLTIKLESLNEDFKLTENVPEAAIDIMTTNDCLIRINLTSLKFRSSEDNFSQANDDCNKESNNENSEEMLDKEKCLGALTSLRRIKWYQNKIHPFSPCPMIVRILRDLCKRDETWKPITDWCLELICERVFSSCLNRPTPSEALRCILQALSAGIILIDPLNKDNVILPDPCEFGCKDALDCLDEKQRIDITESAKKLIQLVLFNKIYQVLDTSILKDENNTDKLNGNDQSKLI